MMQQNRTPGTPCPNCDNFIPMTIEALLGNGAFRCPNPECQTVLQVNLGESRKSLEELKKFNRSTEQARRMRDRGR